MYIEKVLKRFSMKNSKKSLLPLRHGIHLSKKIYPDTPEEIQCMSKIPYASIIGSLMYTMLCIRPDIALAVSVTSRYQANLNEEYWIAVKNILKYLKKIKDFVGAKIHRRRRSWSQGSRGRHWDLQRKSKPELGVLRQDPPMLKSVLYLNKNGVLEQKF